MNERLEAFMAEVRECPEVVAAVRDDCSLEADLRKVERVLHALSAKAERERLLEPIIQQMNIVVSRNDISMPSKLCRMRRLLLLACPTRPSVN
ncbi:MULTISPECIES: hypothetical protein [Bradyrhizobium]|uniref:hypothetical protein n=1 Tax=Bradyrhizobium TaxID=374 RepID=UPI001EDA41BA|nr:hypothetical protein [Bradyrhizobium zhengyangense]MCG2639665.1 hypothetical protein [Bradyrhizobium zhengyangense]